MVTLIVSNLVTAVFAVVATYLFLKHNPAKKAAVDSAEQKVAAVVNPVIKKI